MLLALWLPWFTRRISSIGAEQTMSGWKALGGLGGLVVALAVVAMGWAVLRQRALSAVWLVLAGGVALMVMMAVTVDRLGRQLVPASTTTPAAGLAVAYAGAVTIILSGLALLVRETRARTKEL
ncbi:MAG: hypothetical protein ACRD12_08915 [Acidimicrobiales bacterium]